MFLLLLFRLQILFRIKTALLNCGINQSRIHSVRKIKCLRIVMIDAKKQYIVLCSLKVPFELNKCLVLHLKYSADK